MLKKLHTVSTIVSSLILVYIVTRLAGVLIWVNGMVIDKWVAAVGIFSFLFCIYRFLKGQEVEKRFIKNVCIVLAGANVVWYLWSPIMKKTKGLHILVMTNMCNPLNFANMTAG